MKRDDFSDLAKAFAKCYNVESAPEVFDGDYEAQQGNPAFVGVLLFNCMVMNSLYGCARGGCAGCRARALFDTVADPAVKSRIDGTMAVLRAD